MKKFLALALALLMVFAMAACGEEAVEEVTDEVAEEVTDDTPVMTYEEFVAAPIDSKVVVETYVQAKQSWWEGKGTFYTQNEEGAYFLYDMPCTEDEYNLLTEGTKILVTGYKAEWSGEVEIIDATFEILEGNFVAEAFDATSLLGTEELIKHQNQKALFKGLTVEEINYKNDEPGDDIYLKLSNGEETFNFCVEVYLTGVESEVYKTVGELEAGDKVDVEGFIYWYEGADPHITNITVVE